MIEIELIIINPQLYVVGLLNTNSIILYIPIYLDSKSVKHKPAIIGHQLAFKRPSNGYQTVIHMYFSYVHF